MAYTRRTEKQRAELAARAKALRADGATMAEIARVVGVPAPTLSQWAARDGWRVRDLEGAGMIQFASDEPSAVEIRAESSATAQTSSVLDTMPDNGPVTREALEIAGDRELRLALALAERGAVRASREHLLLGQRFKAASQMMAGGQPDPAEAHEEARSLLEARLLHILRIEYTKQVAEAIGVEARFCRDLDTSALRDADGQLRKATDEERARIEAEDWPKDKSTWS